MGAPKGNKYAVGNKGGRPTLYKPEYCEQIIEYFKREPVNVLYKREYYKDGTLKTEIPILTAAEFPTIEGFAESIEVHKDTVYQWVKDNKEFSDAFSRAKQIQEQIWLVNGMQNLYNSQFAQFFGKNCLGYKDKMEVEQKGESTIEIVFNSQLDSWSK